MLLVGGKWSGFIRSEIFTILLRILRGIEECLHDAAVIFRLDELEFITYRSTQYEGTKRSIDGDFFMKGMEFSTSKASVDVKFHTQNSEYLKKNILIFYKF